MTERSIRVFRDDDDTQYVAVDGEQDIDAAIELATLELGIIFPDGGYRVERVFEFGVHSIYFTDPEAT